jgi:sodium/potassium-transporting ATPase subunit alpha
MVTGDHPLTAEAIARMCGIITLRTAREVAASDGVDECAVPLSDARVGAVVLPGYALPALSDADWAAVLAKQEVVFARTSPHQKLEIVKRYQATGAIVAVTGDGVNDAPALTAADVGVAMGSVGASDVAREAADVVLLDDNFASIVVAISLGRVVFSNLRKVIAYTVAHAVPELLPVLVQLTLDVPLMLPGLILLTVDLVTEQWPATSLCWEPAEDAVMRRPPRNLVTDRLVDARLLVYSYAVVGVLEFLVCTAAFFLTMNAYGLPGGAVLYRRDAWTAGSPPFTHGGVTFSGQAQQDVYFRSVAAYYLTLVLCQAVHVFLCRTRAVSLCAQGVLTNRQTLLGVAAALAVAVSIVYTPAVNAFFYALPVGWPGWTPFLAFAAVAVPGSEASKAAVRAWPRGCWARRGWAW